MTGNFEIGDGGGGAKVDLKIESYLVFFFLCRWFILTSMLERM
jgi:hypothetical protein